MYYKKNILSVCMCVNIYKKLQLKRFRLQFDFNFGMIAF